MNNLKEVEYARDQFAALLENSDSLEADWQKLFTEYPFILTNCLPIKIEPLNLIPCLPGRAEADFYFYPQEDNTISTYGIIEIKRPKTNILTSPRKNVICLSSDASKAVAQAKKYALELEAQVAKIKSNLLFIGNSLHMFIIAGLSNEIARKVTTDILKLQFQSLMPPGCMLITYDTLYKQLNAKIPPKILLVSPLTNINEPSTPKKRGYYASIFGPRQMVLATCSECVKETYVPFKPAEGRPVYCQDCGIKQRKY